MSSEITGAVVNLVCACPMRRLYLSMVRTMQSCALNKKLFSENDHLKEERIDTKNYRFDYEWKSNVIKASVSSLRL